MDAPRATTPPPMLAPTPDAPQRFGARTARKRARAEEEDAAWLDGGGAMPREGSPAKLTCSPPGGNEIVTEPSQPAPVKPTAKMMSAVDPASKYAPLGIHRMDSDPWMEKAQARTEIMGKPC